LITAKEAEINDLKGKLDKREKEITDLKGLLQNQQIGTALSRGFEELKGLITAKEAEINDLKGIGEAEQRNR
jgi:hypothetical protein